MSPQKRVRVVLVIAFMMSTLIYGLLVVILASQSARAVVGNADSVRSVCYTMAAAGLITAIYWAVTKLPSAPDGQRFQTDMIVALALSEVGSIAGLVLYFISRRTTDFWPFCIAVLLVQALFILPRVLQRD